MFEPDMIELRQYWRDKEKETEKAIEELEKKKKEKRKKEINILLAKKGAKK